MRPVLSGGCTRPRRPRWVYGDGNEPDYRFSLANERTFLAWIRTALSLMAAGIAVHGLDLSLPQAARVVLAHMLVALGIACCVASWLRWASAERAMRRSQALAGFGSSLLIGVGVLMIGFVTFVVVTL